MCGDGSLTYVSTPPRSPRTQAIEDISEVDEGCTTVASTAEREPIDAGAVVVQGAKELAALVETKKEDIIKRGADALSKLSDGDAFLAVPLAASTLAVGVTLAARLVRLLRRAHELDGEATDAIKSTVASLNLEPATLAMEAASLARSFSSASGGAGSSTPRCPMSTPCSR